MAVAQTYLQLCQTVNQFLRAGNNQTLSTVLSPSNQLQTDIVYFVNQAWQQLQNDHPSWVWMVKQGTIALPASTTQPGTRTLTLAQIQAIISDYQHILPMYAGNWRYVKLFDGGLALGSQTEYPLHMIPYSQWRGFYDRIPRPISMPTRFTEWPNFTLEFDGTPSVPPSNGFWQIRFDYRTLNTVLGTNTDTPNMPADYQDILVWWAIDIYCRTRSNQSDLGMRAKEEVARQRVRLMAYQTPEVVLGNLYGS